ncbi:hypothetical protein GCM10028822_08960 [Hymenobacter terrigena]
MPTVRLDGRAIIYPNPHFKKMANVKNNIVTEGLSGMLGGQLVFRQTSRGTVVSVAPQAPTGPPTAAQTAQRTRFQQAVIYAKGQSQDPAVQAE